MCNKWPNIPISVDGATGGHIGNNVMICGGYDGTPGYENECYSLTSEKATLVTQMSERRGFPASIVINQNTLWVTGGNNENYDVLASTEYITMTGTMPGPDLPINLWCHAMVAINNTCSMVIGGVDENGYDSFLTFYINNNDGEWIYGPSLIESRRIHAAGIVTDEVTDEDFVAVTGGHGFGYSDTTEILQDGNWVQGNINETMCYLLEMFVLVNDSNMAFAFTLKS